MSLVSRPFSTGCGVLDKVGGWGLVCGGGVMLVKKERRMLSGRCRFGVMSAEGVEFSGAVGVGCVLVDTMQTVLWLPRLSTASPLAAFLSGTSPVTAKLRRDMHYGLSAAPRLHGHPGARRYLGRRRRHI